MPVIENRTDDPYLIEVASSVVSMIVDAEDVEIREDKERLKERLISLGVTF